MDYIKKDLGSYNIHLIKTNKFKTVTVKVIFRHKIKKEEITIRNILTSLMIFSSKNYNSKRKLTIRAQDLYSAGIGVNNSRTGNYLNSIFTLNALNDKYTEKNNLNNAIDFLCEILFNPDIEGNKFKKSNIDIIKTRAKANLLSIKEDSSNYSLIRCLEEFDKKSPVSYRMVGYLEDLENIDEEKLYTHYIEMINKDLVDIFIIGDINETEAIEKIKSHFKLRILKKDNPNYELKEKKTRTKKLFSKELYNAKQSKVNIVCTCNGLNEYEKNYVLPLYSVILGGGTDSKLFKEVREKNSLCYTIYAYPNKLDNILIIQTGIDKENFKKTHELIEKNILDMKKGKFKEKDIEVAKQYFETSFDESEEDPNSIIDIYAAIEFLKSDDLETKRKKMSEVKKSEIIKLAKKIKIDTIFTLEGDQNEKDGI